MIREHIKKKVEKIPFMAAIYRTVRDELTFTRATALEMQGFMLKSANSQFGTTYETEVTDLIKTCLVHSDVFVDIGANVGYYACMACSLGKHVVAIEPLESNLRYLLHNLQHNSWNNVEVFSLGLSAQPGLTKIFGSGTGASLISGWAGISATYCKTIPLSTLDIILGQRFKGKQLLIKADVEGAEYMLLKGSTQILSMVPKPVWIMEICLTEHHPEGINPDFAEAFNIFWDNGYKAWSIDLKGVGKEICKEDVDRWIKTRKTDFGSHNYCFKAKE